MGLFRTQKRIRVAHSLQEDYDERYVKTNRASQVRQKTKYEPVVALSLLSRIPANVT